VEDESTFCDDTCPSGPIALERGVFELFIAPGGGRKAKKLIRFLHRRSILTMRLSPA
jgi:23S rRNA G2445 N2-methylase RlmL